MDEDVDEEEEEAELSFCLGSATTLYTSVFGDEADVAAEDGGAIFLLLEDAETGD